MNVWVPPHFFSLCLFSFVPHSRPCSSLPKMALNPGVSIIVLQWGSPRFWQFPPCSCPCWKIPKEWQTWKCLPFIFIWYLVLVPNMNGYWILFPSQYWTQVSVICRGFILSKHYLSGLFNIKSKHIGICKFMLCTRPCARLSEGHSIRQNGSWLSKVPALFEEGGYVQLSS